MHLIVRVSEYEKPSRGVERHGADSAGLGIATKGVEGCPVAHREEIDAHRVAHPHGENVTARRERHAGDAVENLQHGGPRSLPCADGEKEAEHEQTGRADANGNQECPSPRSAGHARSLSLARR